MTSSEKDKKKKKKRRILKWSLLVVFVAITAFTLYCVLFRPTLPQNRNIVPVQRIDIDKDFYKADNSWLLKNQHGLWEMYVEGEALERGNKIGVLSQELIAKQEKIFVEQIEKLLHSKLLARFLRLGIGIYNRNLGEYIPEENKEEIYAISQYASPDYKWIGNNYQRIMNYHAAHDIGHAVQLMGFVGCSTLGVWDEKTPDGNLLIGRNFDFYLGDKFAEDKILLFVNPAKGHKHVFVTWGGMIGVVSGMNEQGLTIVINAAPSSIPFSSATPVSILAREILQYAGNIDEAVAIANKRKIFVSEQFIIGSAKENKMVAIEKSKDKQRVYTSSTNYLTCTNHFQSKDFMQELASKRTASGYRMNRMLELLDSTKTFSPQKMVDFLRDKKGLDGKDIGLGNEKSIDQLIAHHSIVFHPASKTLWISTRPYQEGAFLAYNLDSVFNNAANPPQKGFAMAKHIINPDSDFLKNRFDAYGFYKRSVSIPVKLFKRDISILLKSNPENYHTYEYLGDYYVYKKDPTKAHEFYEMALKKEIPNIKQRVEITKKLNGIKVKD